MESTQNIENSLSSDKSFKYLVVYMWYYKAVPLGRK